MNGILLFRSGNPFTPFDVIRLDNGESFQRRPDRVGNGNLPSSQRTIDRWFDTEAFVQAAPFTYGNTGRNILIGTGVKNLDLALLKDIQIKEGHKLQLRFEFFNATNTPRFHDLFIQASGAFNTPSVGRLTGAGPARDIQLGLKYTF